MGDKTGSGFIWAGLFHMGTNMWCDQVPAKWGPFNGEELKLLCNADHLRFDEGVWRTVTGRMAKAGMNMVVIDLGEALRYPSHPELAVKGSWEPDRMRAEIDRLRAIGLEPIPKLNFSTAHDVWLKDYARMVSTRAYYQTCADLIRDVGEIFGTPRFLHIGFDEENDYHQRKHALCVVRQGELWWHDFLWFAKTTEKHGMRPWTWSSRLWEDKDEFIKRMPRSVMQSNAHYGRSFDVARLPPTKNERKRAEMIGQVTAYETLDKAGFDQIPTGSNWNNDANFSITVEYCRKVCSPSRLKGFMMAPWFFTLPEWEGKLLEAVDQVGAVIRG